MTDRWSMLAQFGRTSTRRLSPKKRVRTTTFVAELFRAEAARWERRGALEASETLRAAVPALPAPVAADDDGDQQQQRMQEQHQRIRYVEQVAIAVNSGERRTCRPSRATSWKTSSIAGHVTNVAPTERFMWLRASCRETQYQKP